MTLLTLTGVTAGYGGSTVVSDLCLNVDRGEVVTMLGANGAGKTTTLRTIVGQLPISTGAVEVLGKGVRPGRMHELVTRGCGLLPAGRGVARSLTVEENLRLRTPDRRAVNEVLELFPELRPLTRRRVSVLSGGEAQMLGLACLIAMRPKLLLIDELSMGLAPTVVRRLLPALRGLADGDGVGVLLVEQSTDAALSIADRALVLLGGRVVDEGLASDLRSDPTRLRRAYFGHLEVEDGSG